MNILYRLTRRRMEKAISRFQMLIPKQELEHIESLLGIIVFTEDKSETAQAGAGILEDGKYCVVFFLRYLWYKPTEDLLITVAHEFAHLFLEHDSKSELAEEEAEEAVHKQLEVWGVKEILYTLYIPSKEKPLFVVEIYP